MSYFKAHQILFQLGGLRRAVPQTPLGDLTALFRSRRFSGGLLLRRGKRREGRKEQEEGCMVQGSIRHCYVNTVVTEIDP